MNFRHQPLSWLGLALVAAFITLTLFYPVGTLVARALSSDALAMFQTALARESFRLSLLNSLKLAGLCGVLAVGLGLGGASLVTFTQVNRNFVNWLSFLPLVLPPFVGAVGVKRLLVEYGPVNLWLMDNRLITEPVPWVTHFGLWGVALLQALHLYPLVYFQLSAAMSRQDPALMEAARVHGLPPLAAWRRVGLPLLMPPLLSGFLMVALFSLADLGTPLLFDFPDVLAAKIYTLAKEGVTDPMGYVYALWLMAVVVAGSVLMQVITHARPVASESDQPFTRHGGVWTLLAWVFFGGVALLGLLPHATVILSALAQDWVATVWPEKLSLSAFVWLSQAELPRKALFSGFWLSTLSALLMCLGALTATLSAMNLPHAPGAKRLLDRLMDSPLVIPGILVAYGWLMAFTGTPLDAFTAPAVALVCAYTVRRLPLVHRSVQATAQALSGSPFEAARVHGVSPALTLWRITLPLLWPSLFSGFMVGFAFTFFEVSDSLLLATSDRVVPMAKAMYQMAHFPEDGSRLASALGVVGMVVMAVFYALAAALGGGLGAVFGGEKAPAKG